MPAYFPQALLIIQLLVGLWTFQDARRRLSERPAYEPYVWAAGGAVLPLFVLPVYLLWIRPPNASGHWTAAEALGIGIAVVVILIALQFAAFRLGSQGASPGAISSLVIVQNGAFILLTLAGVARRYRLPLSRIGLHRGARPLALIAAAVVIGVLMIPTVTATEQVAIYVVGLIEGPSVAQAMAELEHNQNPIDRLLGAVGWDQRLWFLFLLGVVVPLGEEVYFRGVLQGGLRHTFGPGWALAGGSVIFAAAHQQIIHFLPIAVLGLVLGVLFERTGTLLPSMIVHGVNNVVAVLARIYGLDV